MDLGLGDLLKSIIYLIRCIIIMSNNQQFLNIYIIYYIGTSCIYLNSRTNPHRCTLH